MTMFNDAFSDIIIKITKRKGAKMKNENRLLNLINKFKQIGKTPENGVTRPVYDENWITAQLAYADEAAELGLFVSVDEMGNVYAATMDDLGNSPVILTGSHMDTVINGGALDGTYGDLASLVAVGDLKSQLGQPQTPLVAISFSEEEGSRFDATFTGSRFLTKQAEPNTDDLLDANQVDFATARKQAVDELLEKYPKQGPINVQQYLELHIEQGPVLEHQDLEIGVVTGIVGQRRALITVHGETNHVGTTPMEMRKDALRSTIQLITNIQNLLDQHPEVRYTIGQLNLEPNISNVIPGKVVFSLDMRSVDQTKLDQLFQRVSELVAKMKAELVPTTNVKATLMDEQLQKTISEVTKQLELSSTKMVSGAGHDAQIMSYRVPTGMIFVPSINGISHAPQEASTDESLINGLNVLEKTLAKLSY